MRYKNLESSDELSQRINVPKSWIYRKVREGEIPYLKIGKYLRFDPETVDAWLETKINQ